MKFLKIGVALLVGVSAMVCGVYLAETAQYDCERGLFGQICNYHWWYHIGIALFFIGVIPMLGGLLLAVAGLCQWLLSRIRRRRKDDAT